MKTIQVDYRNITPNCENLTLCLGYFDGVHLGHQKLINDAVNNASNNSKVGVLTFSVSVSSLINVNKSKAVISSLDDRFKIISKLGADFYYVMHIDKEFLNLNADEFIDLLKKMNVKTVYVGEDYHFGKNQSGNINTLKKHFNVHVVDLLIKNDKKISTQDIISLIEEGNISFANKLLGHNYLISGSIEKGNGIGHTIGVPTMNLKTTTNYVLPRFGVYKTIAYINNVPHTSITNVGIRPTVNGKEPVIEVHLPNFNKNMYGESLAVEFIDFIRPEMKFNNLNDLQKQIEEDIKKVI